MMRERATAEELDLALATELQAALLPKSCPRDCPNHVAAARNRMCAGVGGDFYSFLHINDEQIALVIGDVVGHGVRASLVMAQIMSFLQFEQTKLARPEQVAKSLNKMLLDLGERTGSILHCSLLYGVIDTPTGVGFFVNAGHPPPLICDQNTSKPFHLGHPNMLLGVEEFKLTGACHTFKPGERLVMFTDGVTDAINPAGERFGDERFEKVINECLGSDPESCVDRVFEAVDAFRQDAVQLDDETIVVIDRI